jgi:hypothetical protein
MYDYRNWTSERRAAVVLERRLRGYPWHGPPLKAVDEFNHCEFTRNRI